MIWAQLFPAVRAFIEIAIGHKISDLPGLEVDLREIAKTAGRGDLGSRNLLR